MIQVSKLTACAVLAPPGGVAVSELIARALLSTEPRISISKIVGNAVLEPMTVTARPQICVLT